jgi:hypothetical protein
LKGVLVAEVEEVEAADMTALPPEVEEGGEDRGAGEATEQSPFAADVLSVVAVVVMVTVDEDPDTSSWGRSGRRSLFSRFIDLASFNFCRLRQTLIPQTQLKSCEFSTDDEPQNHQNSRRTSIYSFHHKTPTPQNIRSTS